MKVKNCYRGAFNYRQTAVVLYRYAYTEKQAWAQMCKFLADKDGVRPGVVMGLFDGSKPNFELTVEMEVREND
jgi:hypothetical protein